MFPTSPLLSRSLLAALLVLATARCTPPDPPAPVDESATPRESAELPQAGEAPQTVVNPDLTVEGSAFVLRLPDGKVLSGQQMQGAIVHLGIEGGQVSSVRLETIVPDKEQPDILRHDFRVQDAQGSWVPACTPNADGETWGFPVSLPPGHPGREGAITLTCVSGAVGKCARFGYRPWAKGPGGEDLTPYHAACVQMVRADYCGDGAPHTRDGTAIDIYDDLGIQKVSTLEDAEFALEAGWGPKGATCVARTRWPDIQTREELGRTCPRLAQDAVACDEKAARQAGALLFNRSRLVARTGT